MEMSNGLIKPSEQFQRQIQPALDDYLRDPGSERLANNLARAVDHQVDWTFEYYKQNNPSRLNGASDVRSFRRQLLKQCPELQMMNDLSDAAHHRFLTWPSDPPRITVESSSAYSLNSSAPGGAGAAVHFSDCNTIPICRRKGSRVLATMARLIQRKFTGSGKSS
jgi:hypothetical protein